MNQVPACTIEEVWIVSNFLLAHLSYTQDEL